MRAVVQRVTYAEVMVHGQRRAGIDLGLLVYLGVCKDDGVDDASYLSRKVAGLRVFDDDGSKPNLSVRDVSGSVLVVSQFTLFGDAHKGRRPSYNRAAEPAGAEVLYNRFSELLVGEGVPVATGVFRADMAVSSVNAGPFTILIDSRRDF